MRPRHTHGPRKYDPVGFCIYCGVFEGETALSDEHIVPLSLGGAHILPKSSCAICAKETAKVEDYAGRHLFKSFRAKAGFPTRRKKNRPTTLPVTVRIGQTLSQNDVPVGEHPTVLMMPAFQMPAVLRRVPGDSFGEGRVYVYPSLDAIDGPFLQSLRPLSDGGVRTSVDLDPHKFGRLIAKIAHSFAFAELGVQAFDPVLPICILGEYKDIHDLIGGELEAPPPVAGANPGSYHLGLAIKLAADRKTRLLMVRVRLFSGVDYNGTGSPLYWAIAGIAKPRAVRKLHVVTNARSAVAWLRLVLQDIPSLACDAIERCIGIVFVSRRRRADERFAKQLRP